MIVVTKKLDHTFYTRMRVNGWIPETCAYIGFYIKESDSRYHVIHLESGLSFISVWTSEVAMHICEVLEKNIYHPYLLVMTGETGTDALPDKEYFETKSYIERLKDAQSNSKSLRRVKFKET